MPTAERDVLYRRGHQKSLLFDDSLALLEPACLLLLGRDIVGHFRSVLSCAAVALSSTARLR